MVIIVFDSNIYDKLAQDEATRETVKRRISESEIEVHVPRTVEDELQESPFRGVPDFFAVKLTSDAVFILGYSKLGYARLGDGKVYNSHRGASQKVKDAVIADTANTDCDVFVTEDNRCRDRLKASNPSCLCLSYDAFKEWLATAV